MNRNLLHKLGIHHSIGDPYYKIIADKNLYTKVIPAFDRSNDKQLDVVKSIHIYTDEQNPNDFRDIYFGFASGLELSSYGMEQNLWFWNEDDAKRWLERVYKPENYKLKVGDKLKYELTGEEYTVKSLNFGGLYYNGVRGIDTLDSWAMEHSYTDYFPRLRNAWYLLMDTKYNDYVLIGTGTDEDPYRIDRIPGGHNPVQFQRIVVPINS